MRKSVKDIIFILNPNQRVDNLTWYQSLTRQDVLSSSYLFVIYFLFINLKVHIELYLICLTFHMSSTFTGLLSNFGYRNEDKP